MRKVFTLLLFTVLATIGVRAEEGNATVSFSSTEGGKVLTITGKGDLSTISEENKTFEQMLKAEMKNGSYEKIVFVKADGAESLIITPEIANTLVYPNSAPYSSLKELDLRATTITTFENSFNPADYVNVPSVLRLPSATNTPIASGHMNYNKLTGLSSLDVSSLNLTNEQVGFFISNNKDKVINVIDRNDLTKSSYAARWENNTSYYTSFNVFSPKTPSAGNPTEINVYVKNVSSLDLANNASGYVNVVLSADKGTVNNQTTMTTLMEKVNNINGITNLILAKVGLYNSMNFDLFALTNTSVVRIILPDYQKIEEITNASHNPILQVYNTKYIGFGTESKNVEIIKVTNSGDLAKISNAHYYSEDINNAYWQEYQGTLNAADIDFLENVKNDRLNLANATYQDDAKNEQILHQFSNENIKYLALPDFGTEPTDPLYNDLFKNCKNLKAVGQYVSAKEKLNVNTEEEGAVRYITEMLSGKTNQNRYIKYAKISGKLKAEDIFASGNNAEIDADGHAYFTPEVDEYSYTQKRTMGAKEGAEKLTDGALNNVNLVALDLSHATFSHIEDMTLSALNILGSTAEEVKIPTDASVTELPADFLNISGCKIDNICIPGNIKKIHARAFQSCNLKYIWTTGTDENIKYDNGAMYKLSDKTLSKTYEKGAELAYGTYTFSPNLEFIGSYAFSGSTNVHDVYMLGETAPVCLVNAFSTISYVANNSYADFVGAVNREVYRNSEYAFMTVLHFPSTCTDNEAKLYTDITREYSLASDETDDKGKTKYYPTQAEWNRSFVQGTTGYLWNAYCAKRNGATGKSQAFYESSNSINEINISYVTSRPQTEYQTESNKLYETNDYANKSKSVFYDTDVTNTEASESLEYDKTLYANDYRGWHQFVLTSYTSTGTVPTYSKDFSDFSDNEWWTICEPFPLTAGELKKVFGDEVKLVKLISVTRDVANQKITLNFGNNLVSGKNDDDYTLEAGVPYLIKPALEKGWTVDSRLLTYEQSADGASRFAPKTAEELQTILKKGKYTVDAIVINNTGENKELTQPREDGQQIRTDLKYTMLGTFYLHYLPKYCYFLGWDNKNSCVTFYWKGNDANPAELSWNPYTAVIVPNFIDQDFYVPKGNTFETVHYNYNNNCIGMTDDYNGTTPSKRMSLEFFLEEDNGTVTGIDAIRSDSQDLYNDDIYNISGQLVRRKGDMSNLTKGLYIVNGKKYIVK